MNEDLCFYEGMEHLICCKRDTNMYLQRQFLKTPALPGCLPVWLECFMGESGIH